MASNDCCEFIATVAHAIVKAQNTEFNVSSHSAIESHVGSRPIGSATLEKTEAGCMRMQSKINEEEIMQRFDYGKVAPGAYHAMSGLERYLHECGMEESLLHLIKLRLLEVRNDVKLVRHQCHQRLPDLNVIPRLDRAVGHVARDGRGDRRARQRAGLAR